MKKTRFILFLWLFVREVTAQEITLNDLGEFNRIVLSGKMNVTLEQGDRNALEVSLHNTTEDRFSRSVSDSTLTLRLRVNTRQESSADVKITYRTLNELEVATASERAESPIKADLFTLKVANGAKATIESHSKDLTVIADGNSATSLSGQTLYLTITANSNAKIDARALEARSAIVSAQFNAEVFVWGTEKLDAKAGSNATIFYKGTPEIFKTSAALMGSVEQFSY
jgi:hypothetical protein